MNVFFPRASQKKILAYQRGHLGIAAVPGSGKTHTLSALAASIISERHLAPDQEVLIVTLVNSAVENFTTRVNAFIQEKGLIPLLGYRVRTLHGLAHDIVREKPSRVGLEDRFQIIDEQEADRLRADAVRAWLELNPDSWRHMVDQGLDEKKVDWIRQKRLPEVLQSLVNAFIRSAKDHRITADQLRKLLQDSPETLPLAELGLAVYTDYQRALHYRGAVDFDDLIRLSLDLLESDPEYLERLRYRFPYILEDEAQDSSELQEMILSLLSGPGGNWVRVGDPNQAIFETFTTASPELLIKFIDENPRVDMPESGRSQPGIIALANHLIEWTITYHPTVEARSALTHPYIVAAPPGDPQPNPPEDLDSIQFIPRKFTPAEEIDAVAANLEAWLPEHRDQTVAVLVPRNQRGTDLIKVLKQKGLETVELLSSTDETRRTAGSINYLLNFLADPTSPAKLSQAYQVWRRKWRYDGDKKKLYLQVSELLRKCVQVERFVAPVPGKDWLLDTSTLKQEDTPKILEEANDFRQYAERWLKAATLPIDQMILTLAADIFTDPADLALAHKLALLLRQSAEDHSDWRLRELAGELTTIARNQRRFLGFSADDSGFDPKMHCGKVVVTTMHKAKGLEWDRVYLMSVNNYDFPSNEPNDQFFAEKDFVRNRLNLEAEALAQLDALLSTSEYIGYFEGEATRSARIDFVRERLRLLFVAITRARRDLIVTWNTGRKGDLTPALGFVLLQSWHEEQKKG